jgi:general stress protein 26
MSNSTAEGLDKLYTLVHRIRMAMMTTIGKDGVMHSRPMATHDLEREKFTDGKLWFMTRKNSNKITDLTENPNVNVVYVDTASQTFVSVSGLATFSTDLAKIKELWSPLYKAWFPGGVDDDNIVALCVEVDYAEFWDDNSSKMVQLFKMIRSTLTGAEYQADHGEIHINS